jgi:hypothetical protein
MVVHDEIWTLEAAEKDAPANEANPQQAWEGRGMLPHQHIRVFVQCRYDQLCDNTNPSVGSAET